MPLDRRHLIISYHTKNVLQLSAIIIRIECVFLFELMAFLRLFQREEWKDEKKMN